MTTAPAADGDRECKVSPNTPSFLQCLLTKRYFFRSGLVRYKQERAAEPQPGFQEVRHEAQATLRCKFTLPSMPGPIGWVPSERTPEHSSNLGYFNLWPGSSGAN